jgi:hypothetical protein
MIDFPASPTVNQIFTTGGVQWIWDGTKWEANGVGSGFVPMSGGTMTGPLILSGEPTVALGAATKQQVDARTPGENRIINGDMRINQRNIGSGTANGYTTDRWAYFGSQATKITWQNISVNPSTFGFPYCMTFSTTTAYTPIATDTFEIYQAIEADMVSDFNWGQSTAQPATLSFWAFSSLTGTFSGSIHNYANTRSFPFTFNIPTAGVWAKYTIPILGDPNGTWVMSGTGGSAYVMFDLGCGANQRGPVGAWASANYIGVAGSISLVGTLNAVLGITGVKLEIGSVASRFVRKSMAEALADCQRYYQASNSSIQPLGYATIAGISLQALIFAQPVTLRATPTILGAAFSNGTNIAAGSASLVPTNNGIICQFTSNAAGGFWAQATFTGLSAEL